MSEKEKIMNLLKDINIDLYINSNKIHRKVTQSDLLYDIKKDNNSNLFKNTEKVKKFRLQAEYGEKKFIKP